MNRFSKLCLLCILMLSFHTLCAFDEADRLAIQDVIKNYTESWNHHAGKGFGDGFTEDADFVNIFGMHFTGKKEIEYRHIQILQSFLKDSNLEILSTKLREVQPGLVIALVRWKCTGFRNLRSDSSKPGDTREGIFTHVFINSDKKWEIAASQNTLVPN